MDAFTSQQTVDLVARIGFKKSSQRLDKLFVNALLVGPLLGFECAVVLSTEAAPLFQTNAPGLIRTIGAFFFPVGLLTILLSGADLLTGNMLFTIVAFLERRITFLQLSRVWVVSFCGNLTGSLFFMALITGYGGVFDAPVYRQTLLNFATQKIVVPGWHQTFLRGIGANWLVCMAIYLYVSAREIGSKVLILWFPTMMFVALGLDHVIANMYFIPTAIFHGDPDNSTGYYTWKSLIPVLLGNIIGDGLFVATAYWYLYLTGTEEVKVDFHNGAIKTAVKEARGPVSGSTTLEHEEHTNSHVLGTRRSTDLPHPEANVTSSVGNDLGAEAYGRSQRCEADGESGKKFNGILEAVMNIVNDDCAVHFSLLIIGTDFHRLPGVKSS